MTHSKAFNRTRNGLAIFGLINVPGFIWGVYLGSKKQIERQRQQDAGEHENHLHLVVTDEET